MQKDELQNNVILYPNACINTIFVTYVLELVRKLVKILKVRKNFIKQR